MAEVDFQKIKMKDRYRELRTAIAAVRKVNRRLLAILPQWPIEERVEEKVAAFFQLHGKEVEEAVAAFLDALARFTFDEFPCNWPEVWRMVYSSREIQWRLRRHFPDNAFFDRVFHEEYWFFKAITPTAQRERGRAYWELLRKVAGYSRRVLARMGENAVRSLEGERSQPVCLAEIGDGALRKIACAIGGVGEPWPCGQGTRRTGSTGKQAPLIATATRLASLGGYRRHRTGGTDARTRRGVTDGDGRRGRQTEYMAKQRKVFLDYLKIRPETASVSRITRARECWAIHRKEWDAAAQKGVGYADYKGLARANLI